MVTMDSKSPDILSDQDLQNEVERAQNGTVSEADLLPDFKNFNKKLCLKNIRELLKMNPDVKIGQIEKEAGVSAGYMSRLEKDNNFSEPSMEFICTASKLLKTSVDNLIFINQAALTPTDQYVVNFFEKLKSDTASGKIEWKCVKAQKLNSLEFDAFRRTETAHPLIPPFNVFEPNTKPVFLSKSYGPDTTIKDDCYSIRLKNSTELHLMNIKRKKEVKTAPDEAAIEAWITIPGKDHQYLVGTNDKTSISHIAEELYKTIKDRMEHPQINDDIKYAIEAFMNDDLEDDKGNDGFPF